MFTSGKYLILSPFSSNLGFSLIPSFGTNVALYPNVSTIARTGRYDVPSITMAPTLYITTYGYVGGTTLGLIKEYSYSPRNFATGNQPYGVDSNLTGAIVYIEGSLIGDHYLGNLDWQSNADLKRK